MPSIFSIGAHAFAHDAFDAVEQLVAQAAGAGVLGQHVLGLVDLPVAGGVDLVALGGGERADLLRFGRGCGGDLLRFGEASSPPSSRPRPWP